MDASPDPTVVFTALKNFQTFLGNSKTSSASRGGTEPRRLNFTLCRDTSPASLPSPNSPEYLRGQKRNLDSVVGFDVSKKLREKDTEIINTQTTVTRLQGRIHEMELTNKKNKLESDAEIKAMHHQQQRDKALIDDLQHKLKKIQKEKEEARDCVKSARARWDTANLEAGTRVNKLQQTYLEQTTKMKEEINSLQDHVAGLEKEVAEKTSKVTLAESHTELLEARLAELQEKLKQAEDNQAQAEDQKLQLNKALSRVKELELQHEELKETKKQQEVLEAAMCRLPILEKELAKIKEDNKFLRDTARNTQLMEEQLTTALHQVKHLEKLCEDRASQQAKAELYKETLDKFESIVGKELGLGRQGTPEDLQMHLSQLQKEDEVLTDSLTQLRASHKSLENGRAQEVEELNLLKAKMKKQEHLIQYHSGLIKRLNRRIFLVNKERESLKAILSSYESEATISYSVVGQERVNGLEGQVEMYRQEVERLSVELQEAWSTGTSPAAAVSSQQRKEDMKITGLEEKVLALEKEIGKLKQEKEVLELRLEHRALKGDYDPTKTKVLHFKDNPHARALENRKTEIEKLQKENESLQERVRLLEQGETEDLTQRVGVKVASESHKEVMELQEKLSHQERKNKRLMEAFQRKAREMREIVYRLTGYRVDTYGEKQYKLIHMYAESPDDYLLFEHTPAKEIQLLETDFSNTIDDLIDAYLRHENSYPAFLSAITLDLFNRQTKYQAHSSSEEEEEEEEEEEMEEDRKDIKRDGRMGNQDIQKPGGGNDGDDDDDDDDLVILD